MRLSENSKFGILILSLFLLIQFKFGDSFSFLYYLFFYSFFVVILTVTIFWPQKLSILRFFWNQIGKVLGKLTNPIVTLVIFVLLITPTGLIRKFLMCIRKKNELDSTSNWKLVIEKEYGISWFKNQY